MSLPARVYQDGTLTTATPCSAPNFLSPLPGIKAQYAFEQEWSQLIESFVPVSLGGPGAAPVAHPDALYPDYYLVSEGPRRDLGCGMCRWTRTYAQVPASHDEWEHYGYKFPGIWETTTGVVIAPGLALYGRLAFTENTQSRLSHDYFLVGTGQTYANANLIPVIDTFRIIPTGLNGQYVDATANVGTYFGAASYSTDPNTTTYKSYISNAVANAWSSGTSGLSQGQLVAEQSRLSRWMGNIYLRVTRYVLAK